MLELCNPSHWVDEDGSRIRFRLQHSPAMAEWVACDALSLRSSRSLGCQASRTTRARQREHTHNLLVVRDLRDNRCARLADRLVAAELQGCKRGCCLHWLICWVEVPVSLDVSAAGVLGMLRFRDHRTEHKYHNEAPNSQPARGGPLTRRATKSILSAPRLSTLSDTTCATIAKPMQSTNERWRGPSPSEPMPYPMDDVPLRPSGTTKRPKPTQHIFTNQGRPLSACVAPRRERAMTNNIRAMRVTKVGPHNTKSCRK